MTAQRYRSRSSMNCPVLIVTPRKAPPFFLCHRCRLLPLARTIAMFLTSRTGPCQFESPNHGRTTRQRLMGLTSDLHSVRLFLAMQKKKGKPRCLNGQLRVQQSSTKLVWTTWSCDWAARPCIADVVDLAWRTPCTGLHVRALITCRRTDLTQPD